jgi:DNA repair exonuclease SbcCD ATPase subunit
MAPKADWEKWQSKDSKKDQKEEEIIPLDKGDLEMMMYYGQGSYAKDIKSIEKEVALIITRVNQKMGNRFSDDISAVSKY